MSPRIDDPGFILEDARRHDAASSRVQAPESILRRAREEADPAASTRGSASPTKGEGPGSTPGRRGKARIRRCQHGPPVLLETLLGVPGLALCSACEKYVCMNCNGYMAAGKFDRHTCLPPTRWKS